MRRSPLAISLSLVLIVPTASAIVVRHDRDAARFEALATGYAEVLAQVRTRDESGWVVAEGTLIHPRWVITAAHAVDQPGPVEGEVIVAGHSHAISRVVVHPEWTGVFEELHDLALVELADEATGVEPAAVHRLEETVGEEIVLVGRGMTGTGLGGPGGEGGPALAATNRLSEVGPHHLALVFDPPDSESATDLEGVSGPGDSGGPAFWVDADGRHWLVGVSSAQDSEPTGGLEGRYGVIEYYTRLSAFVDWIDAEIGGLPEGPVAAATAPAATRP